MIEKTEEQIVKDNLSYNDTSIGDYFVALHKLSSDSKTNEDFTYYQTMLFNLKEIRNELIDKGSIPKPSWW